MSRRRRGPVLQLSLTVTVTSTVPSGERVQQNSSFSSDTVRRGRALRQNQRVARAANIETTHRQSRRLGSFRTIPSILRGEGWVSGLIGCSTSVDTQCSFHPSPWRCRSPTRVCKAVFTSGGTNFVKSPPNVAICLINVLL